MKKYTTKEIIQLIRSNPDKAFEIFMCNGIFRAIHFIDIYKNIIYDVGIDSQPVRWKEEDFINQYPQAMWEIDQIVCKIAYQKQ